MAKKTKSKMLFIRSDRDLEQRLKRAARILDRPMSQIIREAMKEKLDQLAEIHPELKAA